VALEIDRNGARLRERTSAGMIFVDGVDIGNPDDVALRDRRTLSADGVFIVVVTVSAEDGSSVAEPELIFRGVPFLDDAADEPRRASGRGRASLSVAANEGVSAPVLLQEDLHDDLANFVYGRLKRRPMILPVVVEV
jgi:ribonuclease J